MIDGQQITLNTNNCFDWFKQELNGKRIIGFKVVVTDYPQDSPIGYVAARNIR